MKVSATIVVWLHFLVVIVHALSHIEANIWQSLLDDAFIGVFVLIGPLVALFMLLKFFTWPGALVLLVSMLGSFLYGLWNHFLMPGPDNIAFASPDLWRFPFRVTAVLLLMLEAVGTVIGIWGLLAVRRATLLHRRPVV